MGKKKKSPAKRRRAKLLRVEDKAYKNGYDVGRQHGANGERAVWVDKLEREKESSKSALDARRVEARIKLAQSFGQLIESTARGVITIFGEGI